MKIVVTEKYGADNRLVERTIEYRYEALPQPHPMSSPQPKAKAEPKKQEPHPMSSPQPWMEVPGVESMQEICPLCYKRNSERAEGAT